MSPVAEELLGHLRDEMDGNSWFDYVHLDDEAEARAMFDKFHDTSNKQLTQKFRLRGQLGGYIVVGRGVGTS